MLTNLAKSFYHYAIQYKPKRLPKILKYTKGYLTYPKLYIINKKFKDLPDFSLLSNQTPQDIKFQKTYKPLRTYEHVPPTRYDFIDFKKMSGNEILLNLENTKFLRYTEKLMALFELSNRIVLPENKEVYHLAVKHEYLNNVIEEVFKILDNCKVN